MAIDLSAASRPDWMTDDDGAAASGDGMPGLAGIFGDAARQGTAQSASAAEKPLVRRPRAFNPPASRSAAKTLAWMVTRAALRPCHDLWSDLAVVIAIRLPTGMGTAHVSGAIEEMMKPLLVLTLRRRRVDDTGFVTVEAERKPTRRQGRESSTRRDIRAKASEHRRVFVLIEHGAELPADTADVIDATVTVTPPSPLQIEAVFRHQMGLVPEPGLISGLAGLAVDELDHVLRQGVTPRAIRAQLARRAARRDDAAAARAGSLSEPPTLVDLPGMGSAGAWGHNLARDLADWAAGTIPWADVDRGILLHGLPGTGKTTFAKSLARTCGVPLIVGSIARWQAAGHLGDMLAAMRKAFKEAIDRAPTILFIDELDSLGDRATLSGHNRTYEIQVVNSLLECLDGVEGREGVVVVGACNDPSGIDPAVTRSGRLDRMVEIPLPDSTARAAILRLHLGTTLDGVDLTAIALRTHGWTGADLERIVREARRRARTARRPMEVADLEASLPELWTVAPEDLWRMAVHEAGHAVVAAVLGHVEILGARLERRVPVGDPGRGRLDVSGRVSSTWASGGAVTVRPPEGRLRTERDWNADLVLWLAGMAAEEEHLKSRSGGASGGPGTDLHRATLLAAKMEAHLGVGTVPMRLSDDREEDLFKLLQDDAEVRARVERRLAARYAETKAIVVEHGMALLMVAGLLFDDGKVCGERIREEVARQSGKKAPANGPLTSDEVGQVNPIRVSRSTPTSRRAVRDSQKSGSSGRRVE